MAAQNLE